MCFGLVVWRPSSILSAAPFPAALFKAQRVWARVSYGMSLVDWLLISRRLDAHNPRRCSGGTRPKFEKSDSSEANLG